MFGFIKRKKIKGYTDGVSAYILKTYEPPEEDIGVRFSLSFASDAEPQTTGFETTDSKNERSNCDADVRRDDNVTVVRNSEFDISDIEIRDSLRNKTKKEDPYDAAEVTRLLRNYSKVGDFSEMLYVLERNVNQTFVDRLLYYINEKGVQDSAVYKAAQVDRRLFSKIISNRQYKPSKDTAIAFAFALELSLEDAKDILSRAGYILSHSNKRDIIIEYFFREKVYNLIDINEVLYQMNQKLIGRS